MAQRNPVILFADRDLSYSRFARVHLRRRGALVFAASSVEEVLGLVPRFVPDLVFLDAGLEDLGSDVLVALIRRKMPRASIVLFTANPDPEEEARCARYGLTYYGVRPEPATLVGRFADDLLREEEPVGRKSPLVLCVDDDATFLGSLQRLLTRNGCRVATFTHPERALDMVAQLKPDLAILDVMMPEMNGLNLAEEFLDRFGGEVPVVLLSGRTEDQDLAEGYQRGVSYYITKPCSPRTIVNIVDYLVGDLDESERELLEAEL